MPASPPDSREQFRRAINDAFDDPRPSLPIEEVFARLRAAIREGLSSDPAQPLATDGIEAIARQGKTAS